MADDHSAGIESGAQPGRSLDEVERLEAALARIARARVTPSGSAPVSSETDITSRLDALIADLRAVLGRESSD